MASPSSLYQETLELIRQVSLLAKEEKAIYSTQEETAFFTNPVQSSAKDITPAPVNRIFQSHSSVDNEPRSEMSFVPPPAPKVQETLPSKRSSAERVNSVNLDSLRQNPIEAKHPERGIPSLTAKRDDCEDTRRSSGPPEVRADPNSQHSPARGLEKESSARWEFDTYRHIFSKIAPTMPLLTDIPSDAKAKTIAERWKTKNQAAPYSVLTFNEPSHHRKILHHLATALETIFGGGRLIDSMSIEKENQWESFLSVEHLKLVIICDYALWQQPALLKFYREIPNKSERFLSNTPLFLLPDLSLYLKDPLLKRSLWKALCQKISS